MASPRIPLGLVPSPLEGDIYNVYAAQPIFPTNLEILTESNLPILTETGIPLLIE